jgi:hypothetical protein
MSILTIAKMGHPVLRRVAAKVDDPTDPEIARLAADMRETLEEIGASGLAAPQVFFEKRVVVYRISVPGFHSMDFPPAEGYDGQSRITPLIGQDQVWERCPFRAAGRCRAIRVHHSVPDDRRCYCRTSGAARGQRFNMNVTILTASSIDEDGRFVDAASTRAPGALAEEAAKWSRPTHFFSI